VLELAKSHIKGDTIPGLPPKIKLSERKIVMADLVEAEKNGTLLEVFGTGTAAIVSPVDKWVETLVISLISSVLVCPDPEPQLTDRIGYKGKDIHIPTGPEGLGPIAKGMLDRIQAIQIGEVEHEWSVVVNDVKAVEWARPGPEGVVHGVLI